MRRTVKALLSMVFFVSLIIGAIAMVFKTDFGIDKWLPPQYQWIAVVLIIAWWVGFIVWFIKDQMDN